MPFLLKHLKTRYNNSINLSSFISGFDTTEVNFMLQLEIKSDSPDVASVQNLVQSAIESEIKNLKRSLEKTNKLLKEFETKYQVSSDFFISNWTAENLEEGDEEYISWVGEIKIRTKLINSLEKLENIEYVTQHLPS